MNKGNRKIIRLLSGLFTVFLLVSCGGKTRAFVDKIINLQGGKMDVYRDQNMDFGAVQTVAMMPLANMSKDQLAADRVRDVLIPLFLSTGAFYVLPPGEVARGIARANIASPSSPSTEEVIRLGELLKVDAIITGAIREYGEIRSGSTEANVISLGLQMIETQTGKIVWSASSTKGGIKMKDRLLGGGGAPMNAITEEAGNDLIEKLFGEEEQSEAPAAKEKEQAPEKDKGKGKK